MTKRTLTIRLRPDWKAGLRAAGRKASAKSYRGEELAFETPAVFFGRLTAHRWDIVRAMQGHGILSIRDVARRVDRDVKRVHEDVTALIELGLLERDEGGRGTVCPFDRIHIDLELEAEAA